MPVNIPPSDLQPVEVEQIDGSTPAQYREQKFKVGAMDRATMEIIGLNDATKMEESIEGNMNSTSFVTETTRLMAAEISSQELQSLFVKEIEEAPDEEAQVRVLDKYQRLINRQNVDARLLTYIDYLKRVTPDLYNHDAYNRYTTQFTTPDQVQALRHQVTDENMKAMQDAIKDLASPEFDGWRDVAAEVVTLLFAPGQDHQININTTLEAGIPLSINDAVWIGENRENMRDYLANLPEEERVEVVKRLASRLEELAEDPLIGQTLSDYAVMDYVHSVLGERTLQGEEYDDTLDQQLGNLFTIFEATYAAALLTKLLKGGRRLLSAFFANRGATQTTELALRTGGPSAKDIIATLRNDPKAKRSMNIPDEEVVAGRLPGPDDLRDDMRVVPDDDLPPGMDDLVTGLEARRAEAKALARQLPRSWITQHDKGRLTTELLTQLRQVSNRGSMRIGSTTIKNLPENEGVHVTALFGATDVSGWRGILGLRSVVAMLEDIDLLQHDVAVVLRKPDGTTERVFEVPKFRDIEQQKRWLRDAITPMTGDIGANDEFYVEIGKTKYWSPDDKYLFGNNPTFRSGSISPTWNPNYVLFDENMFKSTIHAFSTEQAIYDQLNRALRPVWDLSQEDKRWVDTSFTWLNDFARRNGRNPGYSDYLAAFPNITDKQMRALVALRHTNDTMYLLANDRARKDYVNRGFITAAPDNGLPTYHGKEITRDLAKPGVVYDPVTRRGRTLTQADIDDLYSRGGTLLEPALREQVGRQYFSRVLIEPDASYKLVGLYPQVLPYHEGYYVRVPADPVVLVKKYNTVVVDGQVKTAKGIESREEFVVPIAYASSMAQGARQADELNARHVRRSPDDDFVYEARRTTDLGGRDLPAILNTVLHQQGRMFYDERDYTLIRRLDGTPGEYLDLARGTELGIQALARNLTMEQQVQVLKQAWARDFGDLVERQEHILLNTREVSERLRRAANNVGNPEQSRRIKKAQVLWDHIRAMEGADSDFYATVKRAALDAYHYLNRRWMPDEKLRPGQYHKERPISAWVESTITEAQPFEMIRSAVFKMFMALRVGRQALLQAGQLTSYTGLDPTYIMSGAVYRDTMALRIGQYQAQGLVGGWSSRELAKWMGISTSDYELLSERLLKSGLQLHADVHSFGTGSRALNKGKTAKSRVGDIAQIPGRATGAVLEGGLRLGFDQGERTNLVGSWLLALRKHMREKGYDKYSQLSLEEWDKVAGDASYMASVMIKPGEMPWQRGGIGLMTQFLSFTYKQAALLAGRNPAAKGGLNAARIGAGLFILYGAGAVTGFKDQVYEWMGSQQDIPSSDRARQLAAEVITAGLIQTVFNEMGAAIDDEWDDLDLSSFAPGVGTINILYENAIDAYNSASIPAEMALGPSASLTSGILRGMSAAKTLYQGDPTMSGTEKFLRASDFIMSGAFPAWRDWSETAQAAMYGEWIIKGGTQSSEVQATLNTMIARGLFGIRPESVLARQNLERSIKDREQEIADDARLVANNIKRFLLQRANGEITVEQLENAFLMIGNIVQSKYENDIGARLRFYELANNADFMGTGNTINSLIAESMRQGLWDEDAQVWAERSGLPEEDVEAFFKHLRRYEDESEAVMDWFEDRLNDGN